LWPQAQLPKNAQQGIAFQMQFLLKLFQCDKWSNDKSEPKLAPCCVLSLQCAANWHHQLVPSTSVG